MERVYQPLQCRRAPDLSAEAPPPVAHADRVRDPHLPPDAADEKHDETTNIPQMAYVTDGAEALAHSPLPRIVILGGPGMGKTTMLRQLLAQDAKRALADANAPLPLYIALPEWARSGCGLLGCIGRSPHAEQLGRKPATAEFGVGDVRAPPGTADQPRGPLCGGGGCIAGDARRGRSCPRRVGACVGGMCP